MLSLTHVLVIFVLLNHVVARLFSWIVSGVPGSSLVVSPVVVKPVSIIASAVVEAPIVSVATSVVVLLSLLVSKRNMNSLLWAVNFLVYQVYDHVYSYCGSLNQLLRNIVQECLELEELATLF